MGGLTVLLLLLLSLTGTPFSPVEVLELLASYVELDFCGIFVSYLNLWRLSIIGIEMQIT